MLTGWESVASFVNQPHIKVKEKLSKRKLPSTLTWKLLQQHTTQYLLSVAHDYMYLFGDPLFIYYYTGYTSMENNTYLSQICLISYAEHSFARKKVSYLTRFNDQWTIPSHNPQHNQLNLTGFYLFISSCSYVINDSGYEARETSLFWVFFCWNFCPWPYTNHYILKSIGAIDQ